MRLLLAILLATPLLAVDIPGGSNAMVEGVKGVHLLKFINGKRIYFATLESFKGFEPKANGSGCLLYVESDKGIQVVDIATQPDDVLAAIRLARQE